MNVRILPRPILVSAGFAMVFGAIACKSSDIASTTDAATDAATDTASTASRPPNILFVLADDQRADSAQCMSKLRTLIGAKGLNFPNNFAATPLCCPGRSSILTGKYAHNHGVITNGDVEDGDNVLVKGAVAFKNKGNEELAFVKWVQAAGYRTGMFGKYLNGYEDFASADNNHDGKPDNYVPPYWDDWFAFPAVDYFYFQLVQRAHTEAKAKRVCYYPAGSTKTQTIARCKAEADDSDSSDENFSTDVLKKHVINFIKTAATDKKPFFAYFAVYSPHGPYESPSRYQPDTSKAEFTQAAMDRLKDCALYDWKDRPKSFLEDDMTDKPDWLQAAVDPLEKARLTQKHDTTRKKQLVSVLATEDALEEIMGVLESTGQKDNTIIVYTADNGYAWGEHWYSRKNCAYEECSRVPLVVYDPRAPQNGKTFSGMTLNVDLAPTFAEWTGATIPPGTLINGQSIAGLASGKTTTWSRDRVLTECWGDGKGVNGGPDTHASARTEKWKYIEHYDDDARTIIKTRKDGTQEIELYDLANDPHELDNLLKLSAAALAAKGLSSASINATAAELKSKLVQLKKD